MPLPKPKDGEKQDDFIKRCMSSEAMKKEFPDSDQRLAVCFQKWRDKDKKDMEPGELRGALPYKDKGAADEGTSWNGPKEVAAAEVDDLKIMCAWVDPEQTDTKQGYKLPHHRNSDKKAVWKGVSAAGAVIMGARGGADIPDSDIPAVKKHLGRHYAHWDKTPPWESKESKSDQKQMSITNGNIERRYFKDMELRLVDGEDENVITGYAAVFDKYSEDLGWFKEKIKKGAFSKTIKENDIRALINHNPDLIIGRTKNKTLKLWEDDKGLGFEVKLPDTSYAKDLKESIKRKDITQNSFGFQMIKDEWSKDGKKRLLKEVKLFDISPVTFPAYKQTSVKMLRTWIYSTRQ